MVRFQLAPFTHKPTKGYKAPQASALNPALSWATMQEGKRRYWPVGWGRLAGKSLAPHLQGLRSFAGSGYPGSPAP